MTIDNKANMDFKIRDNLMDFIFTSEEAKKLNKDIFETIYMAAITESSY